MKNISLGSMKFALKFLYRNGAALTMEELVNAPPYIGNLVIEHWSQGDMFGRHIRQARLLEMAISQAPRDIIPSLFDRNRLTKAVLTSFRIEEVGFRQQRR